jgi:hypothetical protein
VEVACQLLGTQFSGEAAIAVSLVVIEKTGGHTRSPVQEQACATRSRAARDHTNVRCVSSDGRGRKCVANERRHARSVMKKT